MNSWARISVIIPCYNEVRTIAGLLQALRSQSIGVERLEVVIADGMSEDGTREVIVAFAREHPALNVRVVDNPDRTIPAALNRAIAAARGEVVIRLDAHSVPAPDYVERCLEALERTGAANVGGVWEIRPGADTWIARAIAAAAAHPLGAGDARYRIGGEPGPVDTVPFGAFRREWLERVGPFDETLLTNEDYEFNLRLRRAGGLVWFDPSIRSVYFARPRLRDLARQYLRYGYWKARMVLRYPDSLRWRQVLPPLFVLAALGLAGAALAGVPGAALLFGLQWGGYALALVAAGMLEAGQQRNPALALGMPLALAVMHLCWGLAFLVGLVMPPGKRTRKGQRGFG